MSETDTLASTRQPGEKKRKIGERLHRAGYRQFYMVAVMPVKGAEFTPEEEAEFKPLKRHRSYNTARGIAHGMAEKHNRTFVVLGVVGFVESPSQDGRPS